MNFFFSFPSCPSSLHLLPTCPFPLYFPVFRVRICRILCFRLGLPSQLIFFRTSSSKDVHVGLKISFSITPLYEFVLMGPEEGQYYCALVSLVCFFSFLSNVFFVHVYKTLKKKRTFFLCTHFSFLHQSCGVFKIVAVNNRRQVGSVSM
jgi:hypothetical protein